MKVENIKNPHPLSIYLAAMKISKLDFAKKLGISRIHLGEITLGRRYPSKDLACEIEKATGGIVTAPQVMFYKVSNS